MATNPNSHPIFSGEFRHTLDEKNRITIPSAWRQENADSFFLVKSHKQKCLSVMPPHVFDAVGEKSASAVPLAQHRIFIRHFYSQARDVTIDKQGRMLLPEDFCTWAALNGEVLLVAGQDRFELWNPANREESREVEFPTFAEVAEIIGL